MVMIRPRRPLGGPLVSPSYGFDTWRFRTSMEAEYAAKLAPADPDLYLPVPLRDVQQLLLREGPLLRAEIRYEPRITGRVRFSPRSAGRAET